MLLFLGLSFAAGFITDRLLTGHPVLAVSVQPSKDEKTAPIAPLPPPSPGNAPGAAGATGILDPAIDAARLAGIEPNSPAAQVLNTPPINPVNTAAALVAAGGTGG